MSLGDDAPAGVRWVDSHCHLPADLAEADAVCDRARAAGVDWMVCVGTDLATSRAAVALARHRSDVVATVGLHPHDAVDLDDQWTDLVELAAAAEVVAVGEAGLDHHYEHSPGPDQAAAFRAQIRLAHELDRTLVIHTREAWDETFAILDEEGLPRRTVFHCFTGGPTEAASCLARGAYLSFSGIVTFKNAAEVRAAAALAPLDRVLIETDSPYLAPVPFRGKTNEPAWVAEVGAGVAAARNQELAIVAEVTRHNADLVFRVA
ncbi:MAG: TatD family hydrolase [Acidimicrobiia bacterium]|nr:TatD family hydrolase [Acidimicrobiia bacterium]